FLHKCLQSLEHQTISNHKVIVVDDGSTDNTAEIAKEYATRLPEMFTYVYKENGGLGQARNVGLQYVDTMYVSFLDSDDWYHPMFVEKITAKIKTQTINPDVIVTLPICFDNVTNIYFDWYDKGLVDDIFTNDDLSTRISIEGRLNYLEPNICRNVLKKRFIETINLSFPEGTKWEDVEPRFQIMHYAKSVVACKEAHFFYRTNREGQITGMRDESRYQIIGVFQKALKTAKQNRYSDAEINYIIHSFINMSIWSVDVSTFEVRKELVKRLHTMFLEIGKARIEKYINEMNPQHNFKRFASLMSSKYLYKVYLSKKNEEFARKWYRRAKKVMGVIKCK
ncbi:MAG: glycosyltransferase family 2 protein, partial [Bacillota bacterium]